MKPTEVISVIRDAVLDIKSKQEDVISVDGLLQYLDDLDTGVNQKYEFDEAKFRAAHERNLSHYEAQQQHTMEMWRSVITFAQGSIKSSMIINGGAAAALLAFIGNVWAKGIVPEAVGPITLSIAYFSFGVLASALGSGTTYITQYSYAADWQRVAKSFHMFTLVLILGSFVLFGFGAFEAYVSFTEHLAPNNANPADAVSR